MISPLLAYGLGAGSAAAYYNRDFLKAKYAEVFHRALASSNPKAVEKVAVAFGAAGFGAQAAVLKGRAGQLKGASGTPNVLRNPSQMQAGETLQPQLDKQNHSVGQGQYQLTFQTDGNLVFYGPGQQVIWASNTNKPGISRLTMQSDGNLVIYGNDGKAKWNSSTQGNPGAKLVVRGQSASIVSAQGQTLWTAGAGAAAPGTSGPGGLGLGAIPGGHGRRHGGYGPYSQGQYGQGQYGQGPYGQYGQGQGSPWPHHHHHRHPWQGQAGQQPPPSPPSGGGNGGGQAPPAPADSSDGGDVSASSMVSPSLPDLQTAPDDGSAGAATLDDSSPDGDGGVSDAGFGFG